MGERNEYRGCGAGPARACGGEWTKMSIQKVDENEHPKDSENACFRGSW